MTNKILNKKNIYQFLMVVTSSFLYSLSLNFLIVRGNLFPGGFAGISRILSQISLLYFNIKIPFGLIYFSLNIFPTILVYKYIGKKFTVLSMLQFSLVSFFTLVIPKIFLTDDLLLIAIFGGIISGLAISIALRNNASSGGTDFIAMYCFHKFNISAWYYIMVGNAIILIFAGLIFGWEKALYSIIFQFCSTQVVHTFHNRYKYKTLHIITEHGDEVCDSILKTVRHGITRLQATGVYQKKQKDYLYMTINAYQVEDVVKAIKKVDNKAFINITVTEKVIGNYYQLPLD